MCGNYEMNYQKGIENYLEDTVTCKRSPFSFAWKVVEILISKSQRYKKESKRTWKFWILQTELFKSEL